MHGISLPYHLLDCYGTCRVNMPYIGILWDGNRDFGPVYLGKQNGICQGKKNPTLHPIMPSFCCAWIVDGFFRQTHQWWACSEGNKNYFTSSDPHHDMLGGGCQVRVVIENMMGRMENLKTLISGFLGLVILVRWALVTMFLS